MTAADRGQPACVAPRSHEIAIGGGSLPCAASVAARNVSDVRSSAVPRARQSRPIPSPRWREFRRVGQENIRRAATVAAPTLCRPNSGIADRSSLPGHRWAVWMAFTQDPGVTTRPTAHTYQVLDLGAGPLVGRLQGEVHERAVGIGLRG